MQKVLFIPCFWESTAFLLCSNFNLCWKWSYKVTDVTLPCMYLFLVTYSCRKRIFSDFLRKSYPFLTLDFFASCIWIVFSHFTLLSLVIFGLSCKSILYTWRSRSYYLYGLSKSCLFIQRPDMKIPIDFKQKEKKEKKKVELVKLIKTIKIRLLLKRTWESRQAKFVSAKYSTVLKIGNEVVTTGFWRELRQTNLTQEHKTKNKTKLLKNHRNSFNENIHNHFS